MLYHQGQHKKTDTKVLQIWWTCDNGSIFGLHIADILGAAISLPWDFPPKVLGTFYKTTRERRRRAEACRLFR